jgi:hypothetical protein
MSQNSIVSGEPKSFRAVLLPAGLSVYSSGGVVYLLLAEEHPIKNTGVRAGTGKTSGAAVVHNGEIAEGDASGQ